MTANIYGDFQICVSVPLTNLVPSASFLYEEDEREALLWGRDCVTTAPSLHEADA